jgi:hypothetical protein
MSKRMARAPCCIGHRRLTVVDAMWKAADD